MDYQTTTIFTYKNHNFTDYSDYSYAVAMDKLVSSDVYLGSEKRFLILFITDVITFVVGSIGNVLTVAVVVFNKSMRTVTNYYLLNMAVADLLLIINFALTDIVKLFKFQAFAKYEFCYIWHLIRNTSIFASVMTVTAFSVERYIAICKPFKPASKSRVVKSIVLIWPLCAIFSYLHVRHVRFDWEKKVCYYVASDMFFLYHIDPVIFVVLPMIVLSVLYTLIGLTLIKSSEIRSNQSSMRSIESNGVEKIKVTLASTKRTLKMLVTVVVTFFLCWTPHYMSDLWLVYINYTVQLELAVVERYFKIQYVLTFVVHILFLLSTVINPIIYNVMSKKFRDAFKEVLKNVYNLRVFHFWRVKR